MTEKKTETVDAGSGDVLVDLGFADAGERKLRVELAMKLNELIAARRTSRNSSTTSSAVSPPNGCCASSRS